MRVARLAIYVSFISLPPALAEVPPVLEKSLSLKDLLELPESDLATIDIATMNLAAAEGLPGSQFIDRAAIRSKLDEWAQRVATVTASKAHFFKSHPDYYENSWAKYCTIILVLELQQSLGVHYNFEQRTEPSLAKSKDQFIHGIVEGTGGTCASLPVVTVAVGRRLGYPMKLAQGFSHFYVRWDDPETGEQFNIESSGPGGLDFYDDDHYRERAREHGFDAIERGNYLRSMSPREELSSFLTTRADCLRENGQIIQAFETYREAVKLAPQNHFAAGLLRATGRMIQRISAARQAEAFFQEHERRRRTDPRLMTPGMPAAPSALFVNGGLPVSTPPFAPVGRISTHQSRPRTKLDGAGWKPPTMQDYLNETNRRNHELMRYGQPGFNPASSLWQKSVDLLWHRFLTGANTG